VLRPNRSQRHSSRALNLSSRVLSLFGKRATSQAEIGPVRESIFLVSGELGENASTLAELVAQRLARQHNVVALVLPKSALANESKNCCTKVVALLAEPNYAEAQCIIKQLLAEAPVAYAIAIGGRLEIIIRVLTSAFVPVVTLVPEFGADPSSAGARVDMLDWSTSLAFSDRTVLDAALREHPALSSRQASVLPDQTLSRPDVVAAASSISDADHYFAQLERLGRDAGAIMRQRAADFVTLRDNALFDAKTFLTANSMIATREEAIIAFLTRWFAVGGSRVPGTNFFLRRPCAGFHPQVYAHANADRYDTATINPLAHFIRSGSPNGPWRCDVITPRAGDRPSGASSQLRTAVHGHFHFAELAGSFLKRLMCNHSRCDVWLTTDDREKAATLDEVARTYQGGRISVHVVPNRGRNLGAFLTHVMPDIAPHYDVVGHLHGKRSPLTSVGEQWREFLWQNLLGSSYPMMDVILARFAADKTLGMVFPDEPQLPDWDGNLEIACGLAARLGIKTPLPPYFNFPVGNMFWARPAALEPLMDLDLGWNDYPEEPVPVDGTMLHALERLSAFVAQHAGYRYATTRVPGAIWHGGIGTNYDLECDRAMRGRGGLR